MEEDECPESEKGWCQLWWKLHKSLLKKKKKKPHCCPCSEVRGKEDDAKGMTAPQRQPAHSRIKLFAHALEVRTLVGSQGRGQLSSRCCLGQVGILPPSFSHLLSPISHLQTPADEGVDRLPHKILGTGGTPQCSEQVAPRQQKIMNSTPHTSRPLLFPRRNSQHFYPQSPSSLHDI